MKKNFYMTIDVETVTTNRLIYDIGLAIHDKKGEIVHSEHFIIYEIYTYFKNRIPKERESWGYVRNLEEYETRLKNKSCRMVKFSTAVKCIEKLLTKFDCKSICAYNGKFDKSAFEYTTHYLHGNLVNFNAPVPWWDTWAMARNTICKQKMYSAFCDANGFKTNHAKPKNRTSAEVVYAYMNNAPDYEEEHIGLDDVLIEVEIFTRCLRQHKPLGNYVI